MAARKNCMNSICQQSSKTLIPFFLFVCNLQVGYWSDSNFIPMDSKKFEFRNFDYITRFAMKNESAIEKLRSRDQRIFEENRFYEIKTLTHNRVNTVNDKRN